MPDIAPESAPRSPFPPAGAPDFNTFLARAWALLPAIGEQIGAGEAAGQEVGNHIVRELGRLFTALAEEAQRGGIADCGMLCAAISAALADALGLSYGDRATRERALITAAGGILAYLHLRLEQLQQAAALMPPEPTAYDAVVRLLTATGILDRGAATGRATGEAAAQLHDDTDPLVTAPHLAADATQPAEWGQSDMIPPELVARFLTQCQEDERELRQLIVRAAESDQEGEPLQSARRIAHRLKGTAATLQLDLLAQLALELHDLLALAQPLVERDVTTRPEVIDTLLRGVALLQVARDLLARGERREPALLAAARRLRDGLSGDQDPGATPPLESASADEISGPASAASADVNPNGTRLEPKLQSGQAVQGGPGAEMMLQVEAHEIDALMGRIGALTGSRAAMLGAREQAVRLQRELDHALRRLADLSERALDLQPGGDTGQLPYGESEPAGRHPSPHAPASPVPGVSMGALGLVGGRGLIETQRGRTTEQAAEFDHTMRAMRETVEDVSTLEAGLRTVVAQLQQFANTQEALVGQVQHNVMRLRMAPLQEVLTMVRLAVRLTASTLGTEVDFTVDGEQTMLDREIGQALAEPLFQLVRNAVTHGIEPPVERRARGKPERGHVWLVAAHEGSEVSVEVGDDGRGIDPERVLASARAAGAIDPETAEQLTPAQIFDLMFLPGVSTYGEADLVGGNGVGLDSVRATIERVHGSIAVTSEPGRGTVIRLRVPVSLGVTRVLTVRAGGASYGIPFASVRHTARITPADIAPAPAAPRPSDAAGPADVIQARCHVRVPAWVGEAATAQAAVPCYVLAEVLGLDWEPEHARMTIVVEAGGPRPQRVALIVDDVGDDRELVIRAVPPHLRRGLVREASVLADGQVLLLLDIPELVGRLLSGMARAPRRPGITTSLSAAAIPRVLLVDDSISIRHALGEAFARAGLATATARDGVDALQAMARGMPEVIVLDLEMPRMDGFTFLEALRELPEFARTHVIVLTARAGESQRTRARQLGVRDYVLKPCPPEQLVERIRNLLANSAGTTGNG